MYTVNLFKTKFKMKGNIKLLEKYLIINWKNKFFFKKKKKFILHDGPPYANGKIHLGHILNKILKDIIIKFKYIYGYETPFVLGWDCYGLPIEIKSEKKIEDIKNKLKLQNLSRNFVKNNIIIQKFDFEKLGLLTNFKFFYLTINKKNTSEEIKLIKNFKNKNLIYKNFKPIYWCFQCKSNLSELEIKYKNKTTLSIIITFIYLELKNLLISFNIKKKYILGGILIWTTNPWTILANQALCINNEYFYIIINTIKGLLLLNYKNHKNIFNKIKSKYYIINIVLGKYIKNIKFLNPLFDLNKFFNRYSNLYCNNIKNTGTGIVHLAPAYGLEDYIICKKYIKNLKIINILSNKGFFIKTIPIFKNKNIFSVNKILIKYLFNFNKILKLNKILHKYMYCEKHNTYIIYKITNQWFLKIKNKNLNFKKLIFYINKIKFIPKNSKNIFLKIILKRKHWNISRQRSWGTPLIMFIKKTNFKIYNKTNKIMEIVANFIKIYGVKFWILIKKKDILGNKSIFYKKLYDILDVWFDSGTTHWHVLRKTYKNLLKFPANIYFEGIDQYRGWFQSSLITSLMLNKKIPVKKILTHGFVINKNGEKLSKSLNNFNNYNKLIKNLEIDIVRLWISSINFIKNIFISQDILKQTIDIYRKIRNILKFFLSNLSDFIFFKNKIKINKLNKFNKIFINYSVLIYKNIIKLYKKNKFYLLIKILKNFLTEDLSGFYFNLVKDDLYLRLINSFKRKSIQNILYFLTKTLIKLISPILTFTSEESLNILFYKKSIFDIEYLNFKLKKSYKKFFILKKIKIKFDAFMEILKIKKILKYSMDLILYIYINKYKYKIFRNIKNELKSIFSVSKLILNLKFKNKLNFFIKLSKKKKVW